MRVKYQDHLLPDLLLGGRWLPVTDTVLFVNAPLDKTAGALLGGHGAWAARVGDPMRVTEVRGALEGLLGNLLPLDNTQGLKFLLLQTAEPDWTAVLDSKSTGFDLTSPPAWFRTAGLRSVGVEEATSSKSGAQPSRRILRAVPGEPYEGIRLSVNDGGGWDFTPPDDPDAFGSGSWDPGARHKPDRFTHQHLINAAAHFGLRPWDEDFYAPDGRGILTTRNGPPEAGNRHVTLGQARREEPRDWWPVEPVRVV